VAAPDRHHQIPVVPLLLLFAGLAGLAYSLLQTLDARRAPDTRTRKLLARYTLTGAAPVSQDDEHDAGIGRSGPMRKALALAERLVDKPGRREKLMLRLGRANVSLQPNEWLVVQCAATVIGAVLGTLLFGTLGAGLVVGFIAYLGTNAWLALKGRRRLRAFDEHLPNSLQLVAGSLSAGFSLAQALDGVVREGLEPISGVLHRALAEARLGVPLEDALDGIARRMDSVDFRWVVMAIRIQREVGGNLAEVLLNTSMMMRERARLRRQVKALSAEGRLSAYVLFAIPLLMTLYLTSFRRAYIRTLYTDPIGIGFMVTAIVLLCIGAVWMRKIVTVEV
jgi:tight adherence protein B